MSSSSSSEYGVRQSKRRYGYKQTRLLVADSKKIHVVPSITLILLGRMVVIGVALLLISTAIAYVGAAGNIISILLDVTVAVLEFTNVLMLAYLIFGTRGEGHYFITFRNIADALFGNMIGHIGITLAMWKIARASADDIYTITTHDKSPRSALVELTTYSLLMLNGGGVVRQSPITLAPEFVAAIQLSWNILVIVIIFAAADATLSIHTDEPTQPDR